MAARRSRFDPRTTLAALESNGVDYVVIGGLAQVLRGVDHVTDGLDICPAFGADNLKRMAAAAAQIDARTQDGEPAAITEEALTGNPVLSLTTDAGTLQVVGSPEGATRGFVDLRRAATKEHLGHGLQPLVASAGDLARLAAALHRDQDLPRLKQLRRIMELEVAREPAQARATEPGRAASRRGPVSPPRLRP
jgi:hypothetical protein